METKTAIACQPRPIYDEATWSRERLNAFITHKLDDIETMHEPYGKLVIEVHYAKGKIVQVADERRLTHR